MVRLLWVGKERTVKTFDVFFTMLGQEACAGIEFVCSDMWRPYIRVIRGTLFTSRAHPRPLPHRCQDERCLG